MIVAWPQGIAAKAKLTSWNAGACCNDATADDVGFLQALSRYIQDKVQIDPYRVYGSGFSNGALMAQYMTYAAPGTFAAIAANSFPFYDFVKTHYDGQVTDDFIPTPVFSISPGPTAR